MESSELVKLIYPLGIEYPTRQFISMAMAHPTMTQNVNSKKNKIDSANVLQGENIFFTHRTNYAAHANTHLATLLTSDKRYKDIETTQLRNSWQYSRDIINQATALLQPLQSQYPAIHSVVLAGSFGRMEGGKDSDFDFFVIAHDDAINSRQEEKELFAAVWNKLTTLPIAPPDSNGIFTQVVTPAIFCDIAALGNLDYPRHVFGLRMQLLTDSQPIYGNDAFQQLQKDVVRWYCQPDYSPFSNTPLQYLLADLKRYFASYAIWHQYRFDKTFNDSWLMRQIKMHHSRLASYTALALSAISIASDHGDNKFDETVIANKLSTQLKCTPLERIIIHWPLERQDQLHEYITHYNRIAMLISDPELRPLLINENPDHVRNRISGFSHASTPEPALTEITKTVERMRQLLAQCMSHTIMNSNSSIAAGWVL